MAIDSELDLGSQMTGLVDVERGLVNRRIFVEQDIYELELERVFGRAWLYLAHESQIAKPGEFLNVMMGEDSVLLTRDAHGQLHALLNSCRHRGNRVCRADAGRAASFICTYHGWTYGLDGALIAVPGADTYYHDQLDRSQWGLTKVAQVDSYKGLIFATFDPEAPSLEDYLGDMRWGLDLLLDQGDLVAVPGVIRWTMNANWKFAADNAVGDMYHGSTTHKSAQMAGHISGTGSARYQREPRAYAQRGGFSVVTEYGHGFNADFVNEETFNWDTPMAYWRKDPEVQQKLGPMRSKVNRSNMNVFPNLFVNSGSRELMLRNPLGPTRMEIWKTCLIDRNAAPEVQRMQIRASNRHFGPAGMFEMDDGENWDQSTFGAMMRVGRKVDLNYTMGIGEHPVVNDGQSPPRIDDLVNEHCQLWHYRCWSEYMAARSWPELRQHHSKPEGWL